MAEQKIGSLFAVENIADFERLAQVFHDAREYLSAARYSGPLPLWPDDIALTNIQYPCTLEISEWKNEELNFGRIQILSEKGQVELNQDFELRLIEEVRKAGNETSPELYEQAGIADIADATIESGLSRKLLEIQGVLEPQLVKITTALEQLAPILNELARLDTAATTIGPGHNRPPKEFQLTAKDINSVAIAIALVRQQTRSPTPTPLALELASMEFDRVSDLTGWMAAQGKSFIENILEGMAKRTGERIVDAIFVIGLLSTLATSLALAAELIMKIIHLLH